VTVEPLRIGDVVPEFGLVDHAGNPWRFEDHRGRPILLVLHRHLA
jgi:peroxiredoxin